MKLVDKYRPKAPEDFIGNTQQKVARALLVENPNTVLFIGPSGVGKTSLAYMYSRRFTSNLNEVNCSAETGIQNIRSMQENLHTRPLSGKHSVYLLEEVHGLSNSAQNALLKTLENLPDHVIFLATTSEPKKLIPALHSRFSKHTLTAPSNNESKKLVAKIFKEESINVAGSDLCPEAEVEVSPEVAREIITRSEGNLRDLVYYIEQVKQGTYTSHEVLDEEGSLLHALLSGKGIDEAFTVVQNISDYDSQAIGLCHYSIKVIANSAQMSRKAATCSLILKHFGNLEGITPEIAFYRALVGFYGQL